METFSSDPTTHEFRALAALYRQPALPRAAEELGLSTEGLIKLLQRLQKRLRVDLIEGDRGKLALTKKGQDAAREAARLIHYVDLFRTTVAEESQSQTPKKESLRIGCVPVHVAVALAYLAVVHERRHPDVHVELRQLSQDPDKAAHQLVDSVRQSKVDLAMGGPHEPGLGDMLVYSSPVVVIPREGEFSDKKKLRIRDIENHPIVVPTRAFFTRLLLEEQDASLNIVADSRSAATLIAFRNAGVGSAIIATDSLLYLDLGDREQIDLYSNDGQQLVTNVFLHWNNEISPKRASLVQDFRITVEYVINEVRNTRTDRRRGAKQRAAEPKEFERIFADLTATES